MIVGVTSIKGSPGASTFAVIAAALWPASGSPLLIEADASGASLVSRFPGVLTSTRTVVELMAQCRHTIDQEAVLRNTQRLPVRGDVVVGSPDRMLSTGAVKKLLERSAELRAALPDRDVICDLGRLDSSVATSDLDGMFVLTQMDFEHVEPLLRQLPAVGESAKNVAVVGVEVPKARRSVPVGEDELAKQLAERTSGEVGLAGVVNFAPREAGAWFSPEIGERRLRRLALSRRVEALLASSIAMEGTHERIR